MGSWLARPPIQGARSLWLAVAQLLGLEDLLEVQGVHMDAGVVHVVEVEVCHTYEALSRDRGTLGR